MLAAGTASQRSLDEKKSDVSAITSPLAAGSQQLSKDGRVAYFDVQYDKTGFQLPRSGHRRPREPAAPIASPPVWRSSSPARPRTRRRRRAAATSSASPGFFILMVLFRALVPTVIPLLFAIVAVLGAFLLLFLAARLTHFNTVTEILVPMIGLGVGIDYTLFIVTRFRQFLHDGLSPQEAAAAAGATAGRAVIFAGLTVAISITGLALIGLDFITKLGIGSALGVVTAVLLANSLLPAVLSLLGHKVDRGRLGLRAATSRARGRPGRRSQRGAASSRATRRSCCRSWSSSCSCRARRCWASARPGRRRDGAEAPDDAQGLRPAVERVRPRIHRADPGRDRPPVRPRSRDQARERRSRCRASPRSTSRSTTRRTTRRRRSRSSTRTGSTSRRTRRPTTSSRTCGTP